MNYRSQSFEMPSGTRLTLHNDDCIAGMREYLADGSVDVVVTSPPYNLGVAYSQYRDTVGRKRYLAFMRNWARETHRVLSEQGSLFLNLGSKPSDLEVPYRLIWLMGEAGFEVQNVIHWIKSIAILKGEVGKHYGAITGNVVVGHYKPIHSNRYLNDCHEYVFHLTKHGDVPLDRLAVGVPYQDKSNVARWGSVASDKHCRGNTWFIPYETIRTKRPHPATFPTELPLRCIRLHGEDRAKLVMDPFLGIGTTAVACAILKVPFVGFEIDEGYFGQSCARLQSFLHNDEEVT